MGSFKELGVTAAQVRKLMPEWWDDEAAEDEGGMLELQMLLARRLNVSLESLQQAPPKPVFRDAVRRFKTVHPEGSTQLAVAASIANGLAQLIDSAVRGAPPPLAITPAQLRSELLELAPAVTLEALCQWSWSHGVPVVHIQGWPTSLRRPDAMCVRIGERPVILVVRNEKTPAKLAYLICHELGHVLLGHLRNIGNAVLVDDTLPVDNQRSFHDEDEMAADSFAMTVMGGDSLRAAANSLLGKKNYTDLSLAVAAMDAARAHHLDAGQVILGWARLADDWQMANMALRFLMTTGPAPEVINALARRAIDEDALSTDGKDHLMTLTGMDFAGQ